MMREYGNDEMAQAPEGFLHYLWMRESIPALREELAGFYPDRYMVGYAEGQLKCLLPYHSKGD